jgi:CRISPR-associated protein Cmr2
LARDKDGAIRLLRYDGDLFYRESFSAERFADVLGREPDPEEEQRAGNALRTLNALLKLADEQDIAPPHPYLAVLAVDGDKMGALLGESQDPAAHGAISDALVRFAQTEVPRIVEREHGGRVVYAGGDDVLALLPVAHVLSAADRLRQALTNALQQAGRPDRTASAGVAMMHHTHPLESALWTARSAEHAAKETYGRNALVVETLRRSGETTHTGLNWSYHEGPVDALAIVDQVRAGFAQGSISGQLAYDLRQEAPALAGVPTAHQGELARLLRRHWQIRPLAEHSTEINALAARLAELSERGRIEIEPLAEWLLVARFLAQGGRE